MLIGKDSKIAFNAIAFESTNSNGDPVTMVGLFTEPNFSPGVRAGWIAYSTFKHSQLLAGEREDVLGLRRVRNTFRVFLDQAPKPVDVDGKERYDCSGVNIIGFEEGV